MRRVSGLPFTTTQKTKAITGRRKTPIPPFSLQRQNRLLMRELKEAIAGVIRKGNFILGEEVEKFEEEFAAYTGVKYAVGVGSGTDALFLSLLSLGIGRGDEVITVSNTAVPTCSAISMAGAKPVFVDIDPVYYTMDTKQVEAAITSRTRAIMPVHLFGQAADMDGLKKLAGKHSLALIEDACQAHGTEYKGRKAGSLGHLGAFSFYPTKNLGSFGDGGLITTNDESLAAKLKKLRFYGMEDKKRYWHPIKGVNSRLDEVQAAILRTKLPYLDRWNESRRKIASRYMELLPGNLIDLPAEAKYGRHNYHLFVVRSNKRDELQSYLHERQIFTAVHYALPVHLQGAYEELDCKKGSLPITESYASRILSLPMFPELKDSEVEYVSKTLGSFYKSHQDL